MQDNVQRKTKRRRESWIRATEFPVSGREEGISMVAAFSEVVVASPILFTRHGCRHSSKGIRSRLETCLPSWGTMRWVSAGYSFEHLLPRNPVKFMIDYHERLNLLLLPLFERLSTPNSSLIERISSPLRGREFHRRRYFDRVSRLIPCENVWTLHASRRNILLFESTKVNEDWLKYLRLNFCLLCSFIEGCG